MTASDKKQVKDYFLTTLKYKDKSDFNEYPMNALVFSYLMGMEPKECMYMELESEMTNEEIDEYYDIENCIHQIINELN